MELTLNNLRKMQDEQLKQVDMNNPQIKRILTKDKEYERKRAKLEAKMKILFIDVCKKSISNISEEEINSLFSQFLEDFDKTLSMNGLNACSPTNNKEEGKL